MNHSIYKSAARACTFLIVLSILFSSCEKVIDINYNSQNSQLIVEGNITDQTGPYFVKLTQTVNFDEPNSFPQVSGALVTISDETGNTETLAETAPGVYATSAIQGTPGRTYMLQVMANGKKYTAYSKMPASVAIDKIMAVNQVLPMGNKKVVNVKLLDPAGITNFYRFVKIINNKIQSSIYTESDIKQDGKSLNIALLNKKQSESDMKTGDTLTIVLQSIDEPVYNYFRTLLQLNGGGGLINQSTSPANPVSNISNGALGYFNACAVTSQTIFIP